MRHRSLTQRTGGDIRVPRTISGERAETCARLIRTAARELVECKFPLRTLLVLWREYEAAEDREERAMLRAAVGRQIEQLATRGLGREARLLCDEITAGLTFDGPQGLLEFDPENDTTPGDRSARGHSTA